LWFEVTVWVGFSSAGEVAKAPALTVPPSRGLGQSPKQDGFLSRIFKIGFSIEGVEINALKTKGGWVEMAQQRLTKPEFNFLVLGAS